jgi:Mg2+/Co2+ transporter CorB
MDFATTLILVILGILLEAFFSGSEIGMVSVNRIKMLPTVFPVLPV